jgi:hypothetical protein
MFLGKNMLVYPQNANEEKKDGMKNYGFMAISFHGNMFLWQYG